MTVIAVTPIVLKDVVLEIEDDDYAAACSAVALIPSNQTVVFQGLKPGATFTDVSEATWTAQITWAQDWANTASLSRYAMANQGLSKEAVFKPQSGIGPSFAVELVITPGQIGGQGQQTATAQVTWGVQGQPELVEPTP